MPITALGKWCCHSLVWASASIRILDLCWISLASSCFPQRKFRYRSVPLIFNSFPLALHEDALVAAGVQVLFPPLGLVTQVDHPEVTEAPHAGI